MIVVLQCAAGKRPGAGCLRTASGIPVKFVADPHAARIAAPAGFAYARPDDPSDVEGSWRDVMRKYNEETDRRGNPLCLFHAYELYQNPTYDLLWKRFGTTLYILSAGWGFVRADSLIPHYDITFGQTAKGEGYKHRGKTNTYQDFGLPVDLEDKILFFGGKNYARQFCELTREIRAKKTVFYNSDRPPEVTDCGDVSFKRFETSTRTNWHYGCVQAFLDGAISA